MKLAFIIFSLILSCNNLKPENGELKLYNGTYFTQTGGAAGMGPIETYTLVFLKNKQSDSISFDSLKSHLGSSNSFSIRSIKDTLILQSNIYGPMETVGHSSTLKNKNELPEGNIILYFSCNLKPMVLVLNKSQLMKLPHKNNQ